MKRNRIIKTAISVLSILLLIQGMIFTIPVFKAQEAQPVPKTEEATPEMAKMLENDRYILNVNNQTGQFNITCKETQKLWWSTPLLADQDTMANGRNKMEMKSNLLIKYADIQTGEVDLANSYAASVSSGHVTVKKGKDKVTIAYKMNDFKLYIPLVLELTETGFSAYVDTKGIIEGGNFKIFTLSILPYFGAAYQEESGYLFVPDGSGAIIHFNNNKQGYAQYSESVFGTDSNFDLVQKSTTEQAIRMPVFGLKSGDNSFLGIITKGAGIADIEAYVGGSNTGYNNIFSAYDLRSIGIYYLGQSLGGTVKSINVFEKNNFSIDRVEISYHLLHGEDCGYVGMAKAYRQYLIKIFGLSKLADYSPELHLELVGAIRKEERILGIPFTVTKELTTFEKTQQILSTLKQAQVENIAVKFTNWEKDAVKGKINDKAKVIGQMGGKSGLRKLNEYAQRQGIPIYLDVDYTKVNSFSWAFPERKASVKSLSKKTVLYYNYSYVNFFKESLETPQYLLSPTAAVKAFAKFLKGYDKISTGALSLGDTAEMLYSDFTDDSFSRDDSAAKMAEIAKTAKKNYSVMIKGGNAYSLGYSHRVIDAPDSSSEYDVFDSSVPFFQIVLYGYVNTSSYPVNLSSNPKRAFLKAIEYLSSLHYYWIGSDMNVIRDTQLKDAYSADYSVWIDQAAEYSKELKQIFYKTENSDIQSHKMLADGVYQVEWENGLSVIVNYNHDSYTWDNLTIKGEDYLLIENSLD